MSCALAKARRSSDRTAPRDHSARGWAITRTSLVRGPMASSRLSCFAMIRSRPSLFCSSRRRHTRCGRDWSSDVCSTDLLLSGAALQAVNLAASQIASGVHDVVIGSGVEHMGKLPFAATIKTQQEFGAAFTPELLDKHNIQGQGLGAELIAEEYEIARPELDELALRSHQLAHQATEEGRFERRMISMRVNGDTYVTDQGIRPDTSLEALSQLKTVFKEDGVITAGNSSQISDGAAAVLLMSAEKASELGLTPRAKIVDQTTVGCDPVKMLEGPIPATKKILERNSMTINDIDLIEINEAFAPVVSAWRRVHQPDMDRVNVNGGAMAIGHPLGSTGARLITTLLHEMERSDKSTGFVTMCCGGGLGTGTLIERV